MHACIGTCTRGVHTFVLIHVAARLTLHAHTQAEQKRREKARKDATSQGKPLWDEDGNKRGILDKYDESEEAGGMEIDASGTAAALMTKQEEIRQKLAAGIYVCGGLCSGVASAVGQVEQSNSYSIAVSAVAIFEQICMQQWVIMSWCCT